uniref:TORTIFOLIA1/SINE1-2 N-terminal domain-containing protein n=1 Tax=Salix viminalis TaxID=40686 RepID=A0A6N2LJG3_SALVM
MAQKLKLKVVTLITKLSDRDTYKIASTELEKIAESLDNTTLSTFLSCILSTDSNDKPLVRKHCFPLLSTLSALYNNSLSNSLPKILSYITRRLRDPDSSVIRSQCLAAITSLASNITKLPFSTAFLKQLSESVFTEQELNAQIGSALCLAAAIDAAPDPEEGRLGKVWSCETGEVGYKAKFAALVVVGSVIGVGGLRGIGGGIGGVVKCLVGFLSSEDWNSRKAAAERGVKSLRRLLWRGMGLLSLRVKAAREVMNETIEAWKQVPDVSEEASPPPRHGGFFQDDASDKRHWSGSKTFCAAGSEASQMRKKSSLAIRTTPDSSLAATARKRSPLKSTEKKTSLAMCRKVNQNKLVDWKVEISVPNSISSTAVGENDRNEKNANVSERRFAKPETKRALFSNNSDEKTLKFGGFKSGSRVAPCNGEIPQSTVVASSGTENQHSNHNESEDLTLIRNQLVQIERQQSSLLDLLQNFIGSSQNGMRSLETRVHGLELALDEISYDLAVSSGGMTNRDSKEQDTSKFWRKTDGRHSNSRISSSRGTPLSAAVRHRADRNGQTETSNLGNQRLRLQGGAAFIVNPLAEIHGASRVSSEFADSLMKLKGQCLRLEEELSISKQNHHEYQDYIASFEVQIKNWDGPVFEKSPF